MAIVATCLILAIAGNNTAFFASTIGTEVSIDTGIIKRTNGCNAKRKWNFKIVKK